MSGGIDPNVYKKKELIVHIYDVPDTYVGSVEHMPRQDWLMMPSEDGQSYGLEMHEHDTPKAVFRLFLEIISNAGDAVQKSREMGIPVSYIKVTVDNQWVSVENDGAPVPVASSTEFPDQLAPDIIFGELLTSSHYDKDKIKLSAGKNGYGAKLVNIFSSEFEVEIFDHFNKKHYKRRWTNGMRTVEAAAVEPYKGKKSSVCIRYRLNFPRFEMTEYNAFMMGLFHRITLDYSMSCHVTTSFNGLEYTETLESMAKRYFPAMGANTVMYRGFCEVSIPGSRKKASPGRAPEETTEVNRPMIEFILLETLYDHNMVGFVNGLQVNEGVHMEGIYEEVAGQILPAINQEINGRNVLSVGDIKRHTSLVVNCRLPDPAFDSQSKERLTTPVPRLVNMDKRVLAPIQGWELVNMLQKLIDEKQERALSKTDGKKSRHIVVPGLEDANEAGGSKSLQCMCWIVEGLSAKGPAVEARSMIPNGSDFIGIFPIRGKMLNVRGVQRKAILENKEITLIKKVFGFREHTDYTDMNNLKTLRYGRMMIMTDQDFDGSHIKGLVVNFMDVCFPSLLAVPGFIGFIRTPILRVWKGADRSTSKKSFMFYSFAEFEEWKRKTPDWAQYETKYFKGLGTNTKQDMRDLFGAGRVDCTMFSTDDESRASLAIIFGKSTAEKKEWLARWRPDLQLPGLETVRIKEFNDTELIHYAAVNVQRSIASFTDGLKESIRKIIAGALSKWPSYGKGKELKVSQLANLVSELNEYHYGEGSLMGAITGMAQSFVGANNLPFFEALGSFGTRNEGGKDAAAPRYIFVYPERWIYTVFRPEDAPLLDYVMEGDRKLEPKTFWPIFPMWYPNGTQGIGTGYSSTIPNHNPVDVCKWIVAKIDGAEKLPPLKPWYRGFRGTLRMKYSNKEMKTYQEPAPKTILDHFGKRKATAASTAGGRKKRKTDEDETETAAEQEDTPELEAEEPVAENKLVDFDRILDEDDDSHEMSLVTMGTYEATLHQGVRITELPIGKWFSVFKSDVDKLIENKLATKLVDHNNVDTDTVDMFLTGFSNPSLKGLRLCTSIGMTNMVLLDEERRPVKLPSVNDWMERFFAWRYPLYDRRKAHMMKSIREEMAQCDAKARFIEAVTTKQLVIVGAKEDEVAARCKELKLDVDFTKSLNLIHLSKEKIQALQAHIADLQGQLNTLEAKSAGDLWKADIEEFLAVYKKTICKKK